MLVMCCNRDGGVSELLRDLLTVDGGLFPDIQQHLKFYDTSFDQRQAKEGGVIVPSPGVNLAYDSADKQVRAITHELDNYLKAQRQKLKCQVRTSVLVPAHVLTLYMCVCMCSSSTCVCSPSTCMLTC